MAWLLEKEIRRELPEEWGGIVPCGAPGNCWWIRNMGSHPQRKVTKACFEAKS